MSTASPTSLIFCLPSEILQEILALDSGESIYHLEGAIAPYPQIRLTLVCRAWRAAALATHELWSRVHVSVYSSSAPQAALDPLQHRLASFLHHSGSGYLDVSLVLHPPGSVHQALLVDLLATGKRWRSLHLSTKLSSLNFLDPVRGELWELEQLHFTVIASGKLEMDSEDAWRFDTFRDASRLKSVTLNRPSSAPLVPWRARNSLSGKCVDALMCGIALIPALERLTVKELCWDGSVGGSMLTCASVKTLDAECNPLLDSLVFPSLSDLLIGSPDPACLIRTRALLARSTCRLKSLVIRQSIELVDRFEEFRQISAHLAELVHLELWTRTVATREIVMRLVCSPLREGDMPMLERFVGATVHGSIVTVILKTVALDEGVIVWGSGVDAFVRAISTGGSGTVEMDRRCLMHIPAYGVDDEFRPSSDRKLVDELKIS